MFSLFRRSKSRADSTPARDIFRYHDGSKERSIDPLVAWNELWTDPEGLAVSLPLAAKGLADHQTTVEDVTSKAFGLARFDPETGRGLTKLEIHQLLDRFLGYMAALKKKHERPPMQWRSTGLKSSETPGTSTTKSAVDSGSTSPESKPDAPP